jgi:hypothetical protein
MRENCTSGSVRGASGNRRPYRSELTSAIRQHWHVESDNWIRDVTLDEDHIKTTSANQAQNMGCLRSLAMRLLRRFNVKNFQEALEDFADCPSRFEALLRQVKFL